MNNYSKEKEFIMNLFSKYINAQLFFILNLFIVIDRNLNIEFFE